MARSPRPFYKTKAEWAEAMADEKEAAARGLRFASMAGKNHGQKQDKWRQVRMLEGEATKYRAMAASYRSQGV